MEAINAAFLPFARSANHLAKQDGKMRLMCRAALPPINYRRLRRRRGLPFSAINRRLRLRANSNNAAKGIDSRSRENDGYAVLI